MDNVIYKIRNVVNNKFYVGSTKNTRERFRQHRKRLRRGDHHCKHLQAAWNKYGEDTFKFEVVQQLNCWEELEAAEDRWLEEHVGKPHCYNSGRSARAPWRGTSGAEAPFFGKSLSDEAKSKLSEATKRQWETADPRTGKKHSEETKAKISAKIQQAMVEGRGPVKKRSEETRRRQSESLKGNTCALGTVRSPEERAAIAERMKGNQNWLGKKHTAESRAKMGKRVRECTSGREFATLTEALEAYNMKMPTLRRALVSGKPISKGPNAGLKFEYVEV